ncbi:hypothetical protein IFM89_037731, partial [Coptis chinensis]
RKIKGQTAPPNTLLWSLVEKCANRDDIVLLFDMLQNLRRFVLESDSALEWFFFWLNLNTRTTGDVESIWKIENLRSKAMEKHNLDTGFSCAKGFLLEGKPESAAAIIHVLNERLRDEKRTGITLELQKLVSEWPSEVTKQQKEED